MALIYVDYRPPHLQRLPLHAHRPFRFVERFRRDKAECLGMIGPTAEIADEIVPTHPLDPRAHFTVAVADADERLARERVEEYMRATYKTPAEAADEALKGFTSFLRVLAGAFSSTPAGAPLAAAVGVSDAVDDIPSAIADGLDEEDLNVALAVVDAVERAVEAEEDRRGGRVPNIAPKPARLSSRLKKLKS